MTDATMADEFLEEDPRVQLHDRIAESLARLSEANDAPEGVQLCAPFDSDDVNFQSDEWLSRLVDVQGWLYLDDELSTADPESLLASLAASLGYDPPSTGLETKDGALRLTEAALERLSERTELAGELQQTFLAEIDADGVTNAAATASWVEDWTTKDDASADSVTPEPVTARAAVWPISQFIGRKLNLTPSYQRGDVWRLGDRQALIESVLRGIPLPSVILLRTGAVTPHDVVDGKQRLTSILRFVGKHPTALAVVERADKQHPEVGFKAMFETDYPKFRKAWKRYMGEPLSARLEDEYYFPFKLRSDEKGGLVGPGLEPLRGKHFTEIRNNTITVADEEVTIEDLFGAVVAYQVPVLEYTKANPRQIHEVFKLYNKQGMHLNAEEIRNAVYHDVELTRAILFAAGDASTRSNIAEVAPSLIGVPGVGELGRTLAEYGFGEARYRRTKVLGWIVATLVNDSQGKLLPSTARHTDLLLDQVQGNDSHPLRETGRLGDLFGLVARAAILHSEHDELWPEKFRGDGKSSKWQDLPLVGSFVGIAIAAAASPNDIEERINSSAELIRASAEGEWKRPKKTQTRTQWDYIARIASGVVEKLGIDIVLASEVIRVRFGSSGVESLLGSILPPEAE